MRNLNKDEIVQGTTCFKEHKKHNIPCERKECKYWIDSNEHQNCTMIMAAEGPTTLQEIGEIFGVTRMRICQIEKAVINKLKTKNVLDV